MLHDEVHRISSFSAGKAFAESFGRGHIEGRGFIIVERAQAYIVHAAFTQGDEV